MPYKVEMATQLTKAQLQTLPTVEKTAVTCLAELPYYYKDMALSGRGAPGFPNADPTETFLTRASALARMSSRISLVTRVYLGSLLDPEPTEGDYRHVKLPDETEDLGTRIPPEIRNATLELNDSRPLGPTSSANDF
jgi:hypothetical protein